MKVLFHQLDRYGTSKPLATVLKIGVVKLDKMAIGALLREAFKDEEDVDEIVEGYLSGKWMINAKDGCAHHSGEEEDMVFTIIS